MLQLVDAEEEEGHYSQNAQAQHLRGEAEGWGEGESTSLEVFLGYF